MEYLSRKQGQSTSAHLLRISGLWIPCYTHDVLKVVCIQWLARSMFCFLDTPCTHPQPPTLLTMPWSKLVHADLDSLRPSLAAASMHHCICGSGSLCLPLVDRLMCLTEPEHTETLLAAFIFIHYLLGQSMGVCCGWSSSTAMCLWRRLYNIIIVGNKTPTV